MAGVVVFYKITARSKLQYSLWGLGNGDSYNHSYPCIFAGSLRISLNARFLSNIFGTLARVTAYEMLSWLQMSFLLQFTNLKGESNDASPYWAGNWTQKKTCDIDVNFMWISVLWQRGFDHKNPQGNLQVCL